MATEGAKTISRRERDWIGNFVSGLHCEVQSKKTGEQFSAAILEVVSILRTSVKYRAGIIAHLEKALRKGPQGSERQETDGGWADIETIRSNVREFATDYLQIDGIVNEIFSLRKINDKRITREWLSNKIHALLRLQRHEEPIG